MKILLSLLLLSVTQLSGATFLYELDTQYSGNGTPSGVSPWVTAALSDTALNVVQLQMTTPSLARNEFVREWYFNFSGNVNDLKILRTTLPSPGNVAVATNNNSFNAGGGGLFDLKFQFPNKNKDPFDAGNTVTYTITSVRALNASMFNIQSKGGSYYTAARLQGIGNNNHAWIASTTSDSVNTPEPSTYLILGSFLAFAYFLKRKPREGRKGVDCRYDS